MALNIKSEETCSLVSRLATITGQNMTAAITDAVREKLERLDRHHRQRELLAKLEAISKDAAAHIPDEFKTASLDDFLYDENGMPK